MRRSFLHKIIKKLKPKKSVKIPIENRGERVYLPIRQGQAVEFGPIGTSFIEALGGKNNIRTYRQIPNSNRIRLTLVNPKLLDEQRINQLELRMYLRVGDDIIHVIV